MNFLQKQNFMRIDLLNGVNVITIQVKYEKEVLNRRLRGGFDENVGGGYLNSLQYSGQSQVGSGSE